MNDQRSKPGKVGIGPAKTVQVNSGFLGSPKVFGTHRRWVAKRVTWQVADDNPSLLVILQPSGGGAILAAGVEMSRKNPLSPV
jgi:hypothetical protein